MYYYPKFMNGKIEDERQQGACQGHQAIKDAEQGFRHKGI